MLIYTDVSKTEVGVGSAAVSESVEKKASLPPVASIFTAELYAVSLALTIITSSREVNSVVFSDLMSALQILTTDCKRNSLAERIKNDLHNIEREGKTIQLC